VSITAQEIGTQPALWRTAVARAGAAAALLPVAGERACTVGCGTSLHVAQAYAALREGAGLGETDAFAASALPARRAYDVLVAISRSGTTTEVTRALQRTAAARTVAITAVVGRPVGRAAGATVDLAVADERSVVQTRFATTALALLRAQGDPAGVLSAAADAERALTLELPVDPVGVEQWTFIGRGWAAALAHEAALKLREGGQAWAESYDAFEYRHGPIAIAAPGRVVWVLGALADGDALAEEIRATGATLVAPPLDPMASLLLAQRTMLRIAQLRGLDPDRPRNLTRSVVLPPDSPGASEPLTP
jgi:fructoselysine-6-P-deglycase FrlB-like protein